MLEYAKSISPETPTKSGLMLGLGETTEEVLGVMRDLRAHQVDILTLGQYLRPSARHLPIVRYVPPAEFDDLRCAGREMGFSHVEAGPLVRSSYHASEALLRDFRLSPSHTLRFLGLATRRKKAKNRTEN